LLLDPFNTYTSTQTLGTIEEEGGARQCGGAQGTTTHKTHSKKTRCKNNTELDTGTRSALFARWVTRRDTPSRSKNSVVCWNTPQQAEKRSLGGSQDLRSRRSNNAVAVVFQASAGQVRSGEHQEAPVPPRLWARKNRSREVQEQGEASMEGMISSDKTRDNDEDDDDDDDDSNRKERRQRAVSPTQPHAQQKAGRRSYHNR